ncbi:Chitin binding domain [Trinorchestia longiramus]|nr:Chitin binding domain [Trinorchestia longiramus]
MQGRNENILTSTDKLVSLKEKIGIWKVRVEKVLSVLSSSSATADASAGAIQLTHAGDTGVRVSSTLEASGSSFPMPHFSAPTHSASLYPVYSVDSSEFLPSKRHYPSAARSISSHSSGDERPKSVGSKPYKAGVDPHEPKNSPLSSSLSHSSFNDQVPHEQSYNAPVYHPKSSKTTAVAELNPAANPTGFSNLDASVKTTSNSQLKALAKSTATSIFAAPTHEALDSSTLRTTAKRPLEVSSVRFQCKGRTGYFGDEDFGCKVFHFCSHDGKRFTFRCGKGLAFNEMTVSCSGGEVKRCSPALFTPTNSPPDTVKSSIDNHLPPSPRSNDIHVGPEYSIALHHTTQANDETPVVKEGVGQSGIGSLTVFSSLAASSGEPKGKTFNSNPDFRNPFFDHFDKKMKGRVLGSSSFKPPESRQNEVTPEYEYVYDYEYEDEPHPIKPNKLSHLRSAVTGNAEGNDQSKTFTDISRPSRNAHHRHGPPSPLNSVHPAGFQRFSPGYVVHTSNIGPTPRPIVQSTPRPVFVTTTPIYDMRLTNRRPHPSSQPGPFGQNFHPNPPGPHPIPAHLVANRNNLRSSAAPFATHPQLLTHINSLKHRGTAGRPPPTAAQYTNTPPQFYQGFHELHPYAQSLQPTVNPYQSVHLVNPSHLPLQSTGSQSALQPFTSLRARQPIRSPVFSNSHEYSHPDFTSSFHTSQAAVPFSFDLTRPITTTSTQFNSIESPQARPVHHSIDSIFRDNIGSRHPVHSPVRNSFSSSEPHFHATTARPRPTEVPFTLQSRIPQAGLIVTTSRPFLTSASPLQQFSLGHGHSLLPGDKRNPISTSALNSQLSHEDYIDDLRRPTIRFPNRELGNNSPHLRPIPTSSPSPATKFHTTARPPTRLPQTSVHGQTRPPSRRRPASHILRQQNQPRFQAQPTSDRRPLTSQDFHNPPFTSTEIHPTLSSNRFPTPTPTPLFPQIISSNGFSTTARSPLYNNHPNSNYEYEYYDEEYYDDNYDSKVTHRKPLLPKLKTKPHKDDYEYYDYEVPRKRPFDFNSNTAFTTQGSPISQSTDVNSISDGRDRPSVDHRPIRTTTSAPVTLTRRPITRKRPRFPTRVRSRTTTSAPSNDYDYEETDSHQKTVTTTTTSRPRTTSRLTPKRQGIRNRLQFRNRDANNNEGQNESEQTTETPTTKDPVVTTRRPRPASTGRAQGNSRLSALRNRLKMRTKRVKTEAERQLYEEDEAPTQNKSLDEEQAEEESKSDLPVVDTQQTQNGGEKGLSKKDAGQSDSDSVKQNSEDGEPESERKRPFRGAFRKRPLDPEVRARFRKFLKNRRKKLGKIDADPQEKSFGTMSSTTESHFEGDYAHNSGAYDDHSTQIRARENYDKIQSHIPVQEASTLLKINDEHYNKAERRSDNDIPILFKENNYSKEFPYVSPAIAISDTTEPSYKQKNVMAISIEPYSLKNERVRDQSELYQNQESQIVNRQTPPSSSPLTSRKDSVQQDSVEEKIISETEPRIPMKTFQNYSLSEALSNSSSTGLSPPSVSDVETHFTTTQASITNSTTTTTLFSYTNPLVLNQETTITTSTQAPANPMSTVATESSIPLGKVKNRLHEGSNDENMQADAPKVNDSRPKMPHRVAKPIFNFRRKVSKSSERKHFISASDYEGSAEAVAPVDLVSFTMSTDPPLLPLQKLMPFRK